MLTGQTLNDFTKKYRIIPSAEASVWGQLHFGWKHTLASSKEQIAVIHSFSKYFLNQLCSRYYALSQGLKVKQTPRCKPDLDGAFSLAKEASCKKVTSHHDKCVGGMHCNSVLEALRLLTPWKTNGFQLYANSSWLKVPIWRTVLRMLLRSCLRSNLFEVKGGEFLD